MKKEEERALVVFYLVVYELDLDVKRVNRRMSEKGKTLRRRRRLLNDLQGVKYLSLLLYMLLTPRKRLLALLSVICLLPIISLIVTYQKITFASSILENFSPPSASYTSLDPLVSALSSPPTQLTPAQIKMSKVKSTVQEKIDAGKVVVFSKSESSPTLTLCSSWG